MLGAEERGLTRGPATAIDSTKELSNLRVSSYSLCTPAACFVALAASAQACVWQDRRFCDVEHLLLKTTPGVWYLARDFAHTHTKLRMWELVLIADNHGHRATAFFYV